MQTQTQPSTHPVPGTVGALKAWLAHRYSTPESDLTPLAWSLWEASDLPASPLYPPLTAGMAAYITDHAEADVGLNWDSMESLAEAYAYALLHGRPTVWSRDSGALSACAVAQV